MVTHTEQMAQSIKEQMKIRKWDIPDLSVASNIPPRRLAERLTGLTDFHLSELSGLADAFGLTLSQLVESATNQAEHKQAA